ncbi:hypothetical protein QQP08_002762 [Theobroma cacao]|nr:hypothetical protein QQP08_002762 [Theobroma cacao]
MSDAPKRTTMYPCPSAGPGSDPRRQGAVADIEEAVEAMKWKEETKTRLRKNRTLSGKGIRQEKETFSMLVCYFRSLSSKLK